MVQVIHTCHAGNICIIFQFTKVLMLDCALISVEAFTEILPTLCTMFIKEI